MFLAGCGATGLNECQIEEELEISVNAASLECYSHSVLRGKGSIRIEWTLSKSTAGAVFSVQRAPASRRCFREIRQIEAGPEDLTFIYLDMSCQPGKTYRYRVVYRPLFGKSCILFETGEYLAVAVPTILHPNHPNPFSTVTELRFSLGETVETSIAIYDVGGKLVRLIVNSILEPGSYLAAWNGRDDTGRPVAAGVYFCYLRAGKATLSRKLILIR